MKTALNPPIPDSPEERREWIKYQLRIRKISLRDLAGQYGVSRHAPQKALALHYPLWEARIADALGVTAQDLWPERFKGNGLPVRQIGAGKPKKHQAAA